MAYDFEIRVNNLPAIMDAVNDRVETALKQCGEAIEGWAKQDTPVDTGLLRNSLTYGLSGQATNISSYSDDAGNQQGSYSSPAPSTQDNAVYVGSNVEYAPYVEFKDMAHFVGKAHFLRDAGTTHTDELREIATKILGTI